VLAAEDRAASKSIDLKSNIELGPGKMLGDRFSIEEMVANLLLNAIKYTPEKGKVQINATRKDGFFVVEISDTGIGIPADELEHVFDEFYRASNARKIERDGTGLGLSIVKQIIERHNGKIDAKSQEGVGSKFIITLPEARSPNAAD
jgi:signal transduction histidine kinase